MPSHEEHPERPQPPLAPNVDLRGLPFMPLDVARLLDSVFVAVSTGDEFKAGMTLCCKSWWQVPAASLPNDERVLAHLSGAGSRWKRIRRMAMWGWVLCSDGRWYHPVVAEKAVQAWAHRTAQRDRAAKRWQHHSDATAQPAAHSAAYPTAHATALQGRGTETETVKGEREKKSSVRAHAEASTVGTADARALDASTESSPVTRRQGLEQQAAALGLTPYALENLDALAKRIREKRKAMSGQRR